MTLKEKYKIYRNFLNNLIEKTKCDYYANQIANAEGNPKKIWDTINNITGLRSTVKEG